MGKRGVKWREGEFFLHIRWETWLDILYNHFLLSLSLSLTLSFSLSLSLSLSSHLISPSPSSSPHPHLAPISYPSLLSLLPLSSSLPGFRYGIESTKSLILTAALFDGHLDVETACALSQLEARYQVCVSSIENLQLQQAHLFATESTL